MHAAGRRFRHLAAGHVQQETIGFFDADDGTEPLTPASQLVERCLVVGGLMANETRFVGL